MVFAYRAQIVYEMVSPPFNDEVGIGNAALYEPSSYRVSWNVCEIETELTMYSTHAYSTGLFCETCAVTMAGQLANETSESGV